MSNTRNLDPIDPRFNCYYLQCMRTAENGAAEIILEARKRKANLLKMVSESAEGEISSLWARKEEEVSRLEAEVKVSEVDIAQSVKESTRQKLQDMQRCVDSNTEQALDTLIKKVLNVEAKLHINLHF
ncbi:hypothetical protein ACOMHN_012436 [Nucella lapillus]